MRTWRHSFCLAGALLLAALPLQASEVVNVKRITMDLAAEIADAAVKACREKGYQVSAVVVD
ncbi:MAG: heme-binding protein, partial [Thiohalophilus sp.]|nr:heme-binding protein [Thiohalophilus sp.]